MNKKGFFKGSRSMQWSINFNWLGSGVQEVGVGTQDKDLRGIRRFIVLRVW